MTSKPKMPERQLARQFRRAMSRFQNRLFEVEHGKAAGTTVASAVASAAENPFASLSTVHRSGGLATRLNVNTLFVAKLRDRQIKSHHNTARFSKAHRR